MTYTKYNASGNDFVIFHAGTKSDRSELAKKLCDRHAGIGADGLVVVLPHEEWDFEWEFYNSDGSVASMCGNASRAVAHYASEHGISVDNSSIFLTGAGVINATVNGNYVVSDMVTPKIIDDAIIEDGEEWWLIDTGVPHLVCIREDIENFDITRARELRDKYNANVNIATLQEGHLFVRTYERGVEDETLACGTGMVACYVRLHRSGLVSGNTQVFPRSGEELYIDYKDGVYSFGGMVSKVFTAKMV
jgi:diaminopimelate epimerase